MPRIPRGFDIYRVSLAAKMTGLDLPARRDINLIPYALGSVNKDYTLASDSVDKMLISALILVGYPSESDADAHLQHRLRQVESLRRAGEPDTLRFVLSGESAFSSRTPPRFISLATLNRSTVFSRDVSDCRQRRYRSTFAAALRLSGKVAGGTSAC